MSLSRSFANAQFDNASSILTDQPVDDNENSKCENEHEFAKDCFNSNPCTISDSTVATDSQEESHPTLARSPVRDISNNDCIFIPKHAVVDDISLKFVLHPNLSSEFPSCNKTKKKLAGVISSSSSTATLEELDIPKKRTSAPKCKSFPRKNAKKWGTSSSEQYVIKTAKEILYDIAQGKWNRKGMIIDEGANGMTKIRSRLCSNANCVRAAERESYIKKKLASQDLKEPSIIFQDGNLPSYHSLLSIWKCQEKENQQHFWTKNAFKNGFPEDENEFLKVWRECRKNPQAFGIQASKSEETPNVRVKSPGPRCRTYDKSSFWGKSMNNQPHPPPIRLASKEYYNSDQKPIASFRERTKQKRRYEELRKLYPHLPQLRDVDYRMSPATVKYRMRQAEEWHNLVSVSNKPIPNTAMSHYSTDINNEECTATNGEFYPKSVESNECETSN